ncbi:MAG: nitrilase-related carbon-nitrogen hydrolase [Phycisphaerales bacterium]
MRAHLVQLDIAWEDREANYAAVRRLLEPASVQPGDFVLLPELFDSGFSLNTEVTADRDGRTGAFLRDLAAELRCTVQGGRTVREPGADLATNRMTVYTGFETEAPRLLADYSKVHPFSFGREGERFTGGTEVVTYPWTGPEGSLTVCPAVCYDLRFPELFRRGLRMGAELFAIGANWPSPRRQHWRTLAQARAIENQAFVLAVNRTGDDPHLPYAGDTLAIDPAGIVLADPGETECVASVTIEIARVGLWRAEFPAWRDARLD